MGFVVYVRNEDNHLQYHDQNGRICKNAHNIFNSFTKQMFIHLGNAIIFNVYYETTMCLVSLVFMQLQENER